jgi:hypothetical protein
MIGFVEDIRLLEKFDNMEVIGGGKTSFVYIMMARTILSRYT